MNYTTEYEFERGTNKGRPRLIWDPVDKDKAQTILNKTLIKITKKILPWFCHGLNNDDLEGYLNRVMPHGYGQVTTDTDGSSHDAR